MNELNPLRLGGAAAIVSAAVMLLLGILGNFGLYVGAVEVMRQSHMFFSLSIVGIMAGILEASVISFLFGWLFAYTYNKLAR